MRLSLISLLLSCAVCAPAAAAQTMSVEDYWRLTKARLDVSATEWQERLTAAQQANGSRDKLLADSAAITKKYAAAYSQVLADFGMTQEAYLHFPATAPVEVESYLEENAEVKIELDAVRQKIRSLMDAFDDIAGPILSGGSR